MIDVQCSCGTQLRLGTEWSGRRGRCPQCGRVLDIPAAASRENRPANTPAERLDARRSLWLVAAAAGFCGGLALLLAVAWPLIRPTAADPLASERQAVRDGSPTDSSRSPTAAPSSPLAETSTGAAAPSSASSAALSARPEHARSPASRRAAPADAGTAPTSPPDTEASTSGSSTPPGQGTGQVTRSGRPGASAETPAAAPPGSSGLRGLSQQYSDFHCQRIQYQFGLQVPAGATMLEVDGYALPLEGLETLRQSRSPVLFLPKGRHQVRFRAGERMVEMQIETDFVETYAQMRKFFAGRGGIRKEELFRRSASAMDVHATPLLLNLLGASYAQDGKWEAAERKFRRALRINPLFAPAHLNLAHCLVRRGASAEADAELRRAAAANVGNVFGINAGISDLRRQLKVPHHDKRTVPLDVARYISLEPMSVEDQRMVALLQALSKYAVRREEQARILNNLGVHFADTRKPELALNYYRDALAALKMAGPDRFRIAAQVIGHMSVACRSAGFEEAAEYEWMQEAVTP